MKRIKFDSESLIPSKVICIGRNYVDHVKELANETPSEPVIFIKPNSAISEPIVLDGGEEIHYEGEICFLILGGAVKGIGFGLDLTKRQLQSMLKAKGLPWEKAKAFDGSASFSEFIPFDGDLGQLRMEFYIDDELRQTACYEQMIFKPDRFMADIHAFLTLEDGDIVMTGTPSGVGRLHPGEKLVGKVYLNDTLLVEKNWLVEGVK